MLTEAMIRKQVAEAAEKARQTTPLAGSITNFVTVDFVANAQLAVGGSAAMVYLPDEARSLVRLGSSFYINVGTLLPVYAESVPAAMDEAAATDKPWVLDPVALGIGTLRTELLQHARSCPPAVIRGNASEIIALADLWKLSHSGGAGVRGVDTTDTVEAAETAAIALARYTKGAVAVSGKKDLITDGTHVLTAEGGSPLMEKVTGCGCSLGGVIAVYAAVTDPFTAACCGTFAYNLAGESASSAAVGPASFKSAFIDNLYTLTDKLDTAKFSLTEV